MRTFGLRCRAVPLGLSASGWPGPGTALTWTDPESRPVMMSPVPILLYHSISAGPPDWISTFTVSPVTFRTHLDVVVASGRQPITVSQFTDGLQGKAELPARPVLITVDDGFADFADNALPALTERKLPSTLTLQRARSPAERRKVSFRQPICCGRQIFPALRRKAWK